MAKIMSQKQELSLTTEVGSLPAPSFTKPSQPASATSRHSKRLTLNFPILPPPSAFDARSITSSPGLLTPAESQQSSPALKPVLPSPSESPGFLTSLAAQERKVLELREELQKAETELLTLKKQWAQYEAHKKKHEVRHGERMENISLAGNRLEGGFTNPKNQVEGEVARDTRAGGKRTQQRVFSSSRHTRALSLLSPTSENQFPPRSLSIGGTQNPGARLAEREPPGTVHEQTGSPENSTPVRTQKEVLARRSLPPPSRDTLVRTSKQVASDLREGLWTFFEDIRQATVGEEGISGTESRTAVVSPKKASEPVMTPKARTRARNPLHQQHASHQQSTKSSQNGSTKDDDSSFWKEFGLETPVTVPSKKQESTTTDQKEDEPPLVDVDDNWDTWDTPLSQKLLTNTTTQTPRNGDPTQQKTTAMPPNGLPWPELKKFTPSKLTRTVSDLMKEWDSPKTGSLQPVDRGGNDDESKKNAS